MDSRGHHLPPVKKDLQSRLLMSRRWSSPVMAPPLDLFSHYLNGVNVNDAILREHRKLLCKTADGRSRAKHRAAYEDELSAATSTAMILVRLLFLLSVGLGAEFFLFFSSFFLSSSSSSFRSGELWTQKFKSHLVRTQSLNVLRLKPGVGQYIAIHAKLTARDFFLAYFYSSGPFTCIFFQHIS